MNLDNIIRKMRHFPIFGFLVLCRKPDHVAAIREFLLTFMWGFLPILGSVALFTLFEFDQGGGARFKSYIADGSLAIYTAAFIAPISYLTHHVFKDSEVSGKPFPHKFAFACAFYAIIGTSIIVHIGTEMIGQFNAESELTSAAFWISITIFVIGLIISYLGFVYRNALTGSFSSDHRYDEDNFAEKWENLK